MKKMIILFFAVLLICSCGSSERSFIEMKDFRPYLLQFLPVQYQASEVSGKTIVVIGFDAEYGYTVDPEKLREFHAREAQQRQQISDAHEDYQEQRRIEREGRRTSRGEDAVDAAAGVASGIGCLASHAKEDNARRLIQFQNSLNENLTARYNNQLSEKILTHLKNKTLQAFTNSGTMIDPSKTYLIKSFPDNPQSESDGILRNYDEMTNSAKNVLQIQVKMMYYEFDRYSPGVSGNTETKIFYSVTAVLFELKTKKIIWRNNCGIGIKMLELINNAQIYYNYDILTKGQTPVLDTLTIRIIDVLLAGLREQFQKKLKPRMLIINELSKFFKLNGIDLSKLKRINNIEIDLNNYNKAIRYQ